MQTDHGEVLPDPPCAEGLRLTLKQQPGCTGRLLVKQRNWQDEMSYHKIPSFAKKYGLAVEPQRAWWRDYLLRTHVDPQSLLMDDGLHPNDKGKELIATFFNQYFDNLVENWNGQTEDHVVSIPRNAQEHANGQEAVNFEGNRLELISSKPLAVRPTITIDGRSAKDIDGCYQVTRASSIGTVPDWPALKRISLRHDRVREDWTATLTKISPDQKSFEFTVKGSITGDEGNGDSLHDFVSKSGELGIEAQDWMAVAAANHSCQ